MESVSILGIRKMCETPSGRSIWKRALGWGQWLTAVILPTWEAEIGRIIVQGQSQQKVPETPSPK
jgi:hypothetical protein